MGTTPPGWYRDESQNLMRWWDGSEWSDPSRDPRLRPGLPTAVDSGVLEFAVDPSWPAPPEGWFPGPMWEPEPGWPKPADDLWRARGLDEEKVFDELTHVHAIVAEEYAQTDDIWRLDSRHNIPLVWVAPPNWPDQAPGWSPPERWKAPWHWGRAPKDWQFWQPDPSSIAYKTTAIHTKADQRSRALVRSTVGIATLLSHAEALLCDVARLTPLALSPLPSAARNRFPIGASPQLASALKAAHQDLNRSVSNLRIYLLRLAYGLGQPDEWLWQLRREVIEAKETYQLAAKGAAEGVFSATVEHVKREVAHLKPRHTQRREQLSAVLAELAEDVEARARALNPRQDHRATSGASQPVGGMAPWELAEDLAADHLRNLGFRDAQRTPVGADGGFDVEGRGVVAQVKYRTGAVGRPDVQRLVGANRHGATAVFYSRAGYTQGAIDYARHTGVALFEVDANTSDICAVNDSAQALTGRSR